jgi:hypothetical protein
MSNFMSRSLVLVVLVACVAGSLFPIRSYGADLAGAEALARGYFGRSDVVVLTERQREWMRADYAQRVRMAEQMGEIGAREFARSRGLIALSSDPQRGVRQGLDQIYRTPQGNIVAIEAKGGGSRVGKYFGYVQGTAEHAVASSEHIVMRPGIDAKVKTAHMEVLRAAAENRLEVNVVRTRHVFGEPVTTALESQMQSSQNAGEMARKALKKLPAAPKSPVLPPRGPVSEPRNDRKPTAVTGTVHPNQTTGKGLPKLSSTTAKALKAGGAVADVGLRIAAAVETESRHAAGEITDKEREAAHMRNVTSMVGGWGGASAGASTFGTLAAPVAAMTRPVAPFVLGGAVLTGGALGYLGGEQVATCASDWAMSKIHKGGVTISGTVDSGWKGAKEAVSDARDTASRVWYQYRPW